MAAGEGSAPAVALPPGATAPDLIFRIAAEDGIGLRAAIWRGGGRGLALLLPGRTEFIEKVALPATALRRLGFAVASLDWRGQGLSDRLLAEPLKGHVDDFAEYDRDLAALMAAGPVAAEGAPRLVVAHSMGGTIALGPAQARIGGLPIVLTAPLLGIAFPAGVRTAAALLPRLATVMGYAGRWPPVGDPEVPYPLRTAAEANALTGDPALFNWLLRAIADEPRFALAMPTLGWFRAAERAIQVARQARPSRAFVALGGAEAIVDAAAIRRFAREAGAEFLEIPEGRHDLPIETEAIRAQIWAAVDRFVG